MQVLSRCPLGVASILWLPRSGSYTLTVVCKATFRLEPELSPLAAEQEPVTEGDTYWDHDESKSLEAATDLVPFKRSPELLIVGHAFAPHGAQVGTLVARVTVGEIDKAIEITGDRHFTLDGALSHPARFAKMPLRWERAAGGPDTSNPVGVVMGEEARADGWGRFAVPNLVQLGRVVSSREDVVPPAGFGPMAPHWPVRLARLHRHAVGWSPHAWHARPLPADFDAGYFNAAPPDQLLREIGGTERVTLENLHPRHPVLATRLERVTPRAKVDWGSGGAHEIGLACDTLLIDTDRGLATLTWRGHVTLDYPERAGWVIVTADEAGGAAEVGWEGRARTAEPPRAAAFGAGAGAGPARGAPTFGLPAWVAGVKDVNETVAHEGDDGAAVALPFVGRGSALDVELPDDLDDEETFAGGREGVPAAAAAAPGGVPAVPPVVPKGPRLGAFRLAASSEHPAAGAGAAEPGAAGVPRGGVDLEDAPTMDPDDAILEELTEDPSTEKPALPLGVPVAAAELGAAPPPPVGARRPSTWVGTAMPVSAVMPFAPSGVGVAAAAAALEETGARAAASVTGLPFAPVTPVPAPPPSRSSATGRTIGELVAQTRGLPLDGPTGFAAEPTHDLGAAPAAADPPPAPPPRLGPLATPAMVTEDLATSGAPASPPVEPSSVASAGVAAPPSAAAETPAEAPAAAPGARAAPAEPGALPLDEYPIDRCARIAASVARSRDRTDEILEAQALDAERWEPLKEHWAAEIKKETERGKTALLRAYDAAYVAQLEDERGPIAVEEYARIVVASERGTVSATLAELGLPEGSMLRIQRVWMGRTGKDPELRRLVRSAVEMASDA